MALLKGLLPLHAHRSKAGELCGDRLNQVDRFGSQLNLTLEDETLASEQLALLLTLDELLQDQIDELALQPSVLRRRKNFEMSERDVGWVSLAVL